MQKVTIAGGGVLGTQIAFMNAYNDNDTTIWLRSEGSIARMKPKIKWVHDAVMADLEAARRNPALVPAGFKTDEPFDADQAIEKAEEAFKAIKITLDLDEAAKDADVLIEAVSEDPQDKIEFYNRLRPSLKEKTLLLTNSSSMLPSIFAKYTGDPARYLAMHFANHIWKENLVEIMSQPETSKEAFEQAVAYAHSIGMDPVELHKEKAGYLLNSMLIPFLLAAQDLYVTETASLEDIDKAWKKGTGAPRGPFEILDIVGLPTARNINHQFVNIPDEAAPFHYKLIEKQLDKMIANGETFYGKKK